MFSIPKKNVKKIENVDSSSLLSLKALIDRTKKKRKKSEPSVVTKKRKIQNAGVEKRSAKDLEYRDEERKRLKRSKRALEKKAEMYNRMISGSPKNESTESSYLVDFEKKKKKKPNADATTGKKILIKDEFGRDRWVEPGSEEHRNVLQYIEEHEYSQHDDDDDKHLGTIRRIDGGVKSQLDNVLSEAEKRELERVREETKRGRELSRQKQKRRDEILNRLEQQNVTGRKANKKKASELVQQMLLKKAQRCKGDRETGITDEERSQRLLSEIFI